MVAGFGIRQKEHRTKMSLASRPGILIGELCQPKNTTGMMWRSSDWTEFLKVTYSIRESHNHGSQPTTTDDGGEDEG